jgi:hypothetical protein
MHIVLFAETSTATDASTSMLDEQQHEEATSKQAN